MKNVRKIYFRKAEDIPNNTLPVLVYRGVLAANVREGQALPRAIQG